LINTLPKESINDEIEYSIDSSRRIGDLSMNSNGGFLPLS